MSGSLKSIAERLVRTREALKLSQADFCAEIGVRPNIYNPFETGKRRITIDVAMRIRARFGIPLDWIYCGDDRQLPAYLYRELHAAA